MIGNRVGIVSEADSDVAEDVVLGREEVLPDVVENVGRIGDNITIWDHPWHTWIVEVIPEPGLRVLAIGCVMAKREASVMVWHSIKVIEERDILV